MRIALFECKIPDLISSSEQDGDRFKPPQLVTKDDPLWPLAACLQEEEKHND